MSLMKRLSEVRKVALHLPARVDREGLGHQKRQKGRQTSLLPRRNWESYELRASNYRIIICSKLIEFEN